ncbi:(2Fe-2S) ferredoxin domain-containing protein [Neosynechococcus sphagnicola]|uniref:(2Fe-2S) ferredoxin domain-containing protein n=1 Tax=Neosynechococcus sphagnicola TaxID=1501145 RepID=UPI0005611A2E|nr:(2Fe-2S) ferredoxin domain-containing protein [Neosynechococcus sphagnicola]
MAHFDTKSPMEFNFQGQFLGFVSHDGAWKYMRLRVLSEELQIKIPKAMRLTVGSSLQPGESIQVIGISKFDRHAHAPKLKATQLIPLTENSPPIVPVIPTRRASSAPPAAQTQLKVKPKVKVLLCQKSGCLKRGSKGLYEALDQILCDRNLQHQVTIEPTGCLKCCSSAPNLTIIPVNHRYKDVRLKMLPQIVDAIAQSLTKH